MALAKLKMDEEALLEFELQVFGTAEQIAQTRFVIEGTQFDIVCKCRTTETGVEVHVPKLRGLLESGMHTVKLETIIDNKIFTPLTESVELLPMVEFDVKQKSVEPVLEKVKATVKAIVIEDKNPALTKLLESGAEVVRYNDFEVVRDKSGYIGLVAEGSVIRAKKSHSTLSGLVAELEQ